MVLLEDWQFDLHIFYLCSILTTLTCNLFCIIFNYAMFNNFIIKLSVINLCFCLFYVHFLKVQKFLDLNI